MYVQFIGRVAGTPERKNSKNGNEYYQYRIVEETRFGGSDISTWYTIKDMTPRRIYGIVKKGSLLFISGELAPVDAFNGKDGKIHLEFTVFANSVSFVPVNRNQYTNNTVQTSTSQDSMNSSQMVVVTQPQVQTTPVYNTPQHNYNNRTQEVSANTADEDLPF